ncbi:hypothetical protein CSB11_00630 [Candidatus Campbellbacteria bacterium]|nr:MAG: hypothetical protein CSB11_00630 [Candidatus Campbellbacteria bacterium]
MKKIFFLILTIIFLSVWAHSLKIFVEMGLSNLFAFILGGFFAQAGLSIVILTPYYLWKLKNKII